MSVYTPNIPQPGDNPSDSQDQILENFQTLNTIYGTGGDHYAWTNTNPPETAKHAKVTLPGLPTATAPGNALPTTVSGNCAIFAQTVSSQTAPYLTRDGLAPTAPVINIWPLLPIKAYAQMNITSLNVVTINDSFNVASATSTSAGRQVTITLTNAMKSANYGILTTCTGPVGVTANTSPTNATTFTVFLGGAGISAFTGILTVAVISS